MTPQRHAPDDELSGLLDDALPPDRLAAIRAEVDADPRLGEELRELAAVRDLVASLPRPTAAVDISDIVLGAIAAEGLVPKDWRLRIFEAAGRTSMAFRVAAVAAGLIGVAALPVLVPLYLNREGPVAPAVAVRVAPVAPAPVVTASVLGESDEVAAVAERPKPPVALGPSPEEVRLDQESEKFRRLLDSPSLGKVFFVTDVIDAEPDRRVDWLLREGPRRYANYVCIALSPETNPDPDRPGAASVYAVVMDDQEVDRLRADLAWAFPVGTIVEEEPRPETVTRLADAGRVEVLEGTAVADLVDRKDEANAHRVRDDQSIQFSPLRIPFWLPPEMMGQLSDHDPEPAEGPPGPPEDAPAPTNPEPAFDPASSTRPSRSVVLVWVTRPGPGVGVVP